MFVRALINILYQMTFERRPAGNDLLLLQMLYFLQVYLVHVNKQIYYIHVYINIVYIYIHER